MWIDNKDFIKWNKIGLDIEDAFLDNHELSRKFIMKSTNFNLENEMVCLKELYNNILDNVEDDSIKYSIKSDLRNQLKFMKKVEKKIIKSKKQHHKLSLEKISKIKNKLFPNKILQERFDNFIPYYLNYGKQFIKTLKSEIDPLDTNFLILSIEKSKNDS